MVVIGLMGFGFVIETIARLIPTKDPHSVTTRIGLSMGDFGHRLVAIGKLIEGFLTFIKVPNNLKK